jgi:hypothetical protein
MLSTILTTATIAKNIAWESRFNRYIGNPLRETFGHETTYQAAARGLTQGHNAARYDMILADLELMYIENTTR